jgi:lipoprotein-anchoring transpeptidase ErfK/SrfK
MPHHVTLRILWSAMRTLLGRAAATTVAGFAMLTSASMVVPPTVAATPPSSTTTPTTTTPTTTTPEPLVVEIPNPGAVTPQRGTQAQVAPTQPPPPTTTTTTLPPEHLLPGNSGTGRRVVYRKSWPMRVWLVEANGSVSKSHLVSGRADWNQPTPGTYSVFSRSGYTCNINNPHICWRYMVRFTKGPGGDNIGFHEIPTNLRTGYRLQSESQLGQALSGGCVRQATSDAIYMWNWAPIGTKVVVLP